MTVMVAVGRDSNEGVGSEGRGVCRSVRIGVRGQLRDVCGDAQSTANRRGGFQKIAAGDARRFCGREIRRVGAGQL